MGNENVEKNIGYKNPIIKYNAYHHGMYRSG